MDGVSFKEEPDLMEGCVLKKEDVMGLDVFDSEGRKLGTVSDVEFTLDSKLTLLIDNGKKNKIPFDMINAIGDVILLKGKKKARK